jgi:hypothetical protein
MKTLSTVSNTRRLRVFENGVLRKICGPKRDAVTGRWRKSFSEELHNLYSPPNTIGVSKCRRVRMAEHEKRMTEKRNAYRILMGKPDEIEYFEKLIVDGRIALELILQRYDKRRWTGVMCLSERTNSRLL